MANRPEPVFESEFQVVFLDGHEVMLHFFRNCRSTITSSDLEALKESKVFVKRVVDGTITNWEEPSQHHDFPFAAIATYIGLDLRHSDYRRKTYVKNAVLD